MLDTLLNGRISVSMLAGSALLLVAVGGWGSFAASSISSGRQVSALTSQRDAAVAERTKLQETAGQLAEIETKIGAARTEHGRQMQALTDVKAKIASAQQELAALNRRVEQKANKADQTGSIRPPEPPKKPAR